MAQATHMTRQSRTGLALGAPPLPREHGAWVIVYAPMLIAGIGAAVPVGKLLLLALGVTGLYLARNVAALLLRRRLDPCLARWLAIYGAVAAVGLAPLLWSRQGALLIAIGGLAAVLFGVHAALASLRRRDRTVSGELLGVLALTLTAPAMLIAAGAPLDTEALRLWAVCAAFFGSGIVYVKMVLAAAIAGRNKHAPAGALPLALRARLGALHLTYHAGMVAIALAEAGRLGGIAGTLAAFAFAPAVARSVIGWLSMHGTLPPLRRVGLAESAIAIWFTFLYAAALRVAMAS